MSYDDLGYETKLASVTYDLLRKMEETEEKLDQ